MKRIILTIVLLSSFLFAKENLTLNLQNEVYLLPKESKIVKEKIIKLISNSKSDIKIAMYNFSYKKFAKQLASASKKGIKVKVLFDRSKIKKDDKIFKYLRANNVETIVTKKKLHTKIAVFDSKIALVGSMNWTKESFKNNYEVIVFTKDNRVVSKLDNFIDKH